MTASEAEPRAVLDRDPDDEAKAEPERTRAKPAAPAPAPNPSADAPASGAGADDAAAKAAVAGDVDRVAGPMRVASGGLLIDRAKPVAFSFNNKALKGYRGDSLASALLAHGRHFVGRSFKYHRPRGIVASGVEEPNALMGVGTDARFEPNQRATMVELHDGLTAKSQNHWPSLEFDIGAINSHLSRFYPSGFYYKTFIRPRFAWKHIFEPFIRQAAGLGKAPTAADPDRYEHFHYHADVLVAGGGVAGLRAARAAAEAGARVLLVEQQSWLGGRALVDVSAEERDGRAEWLAAEVDALRAMPNVAIRLRAQASWIEDHGYALVYERLTDHGPADGAGKPRHRLWRVRAKQIVAAAGAVERPIAFANNDLPGVMLASAVRDYLALYAVAAGAKVALFTNNDDAYRTAIALDDAGVAAPVVVDSRPGSDGDLPREAAARGLDVRFGAVVAKAHGVKRIEAIDVARLRASGRLGASERIACDALGVSGGWSPLAHLWSQAGGKLYWDDAALMFKPDEARGPVGADGRMSVRAAGSARGLLSGVDVAEDGWRAGAEAASSAGYDMKGREIAYAPAALASPAEGAIAPLWFTPSRAKESTGAKHFVDFQNDVTAADVELAAREGYESVEHLKRYTTLGMATDQGKLSNINGLAILADARGCAIGEVGTTTFRPPYTPISFGAVAGREAKGLFKAVRKTQIHQRHVEAGAHFEPVGDWRRPYAFPRTVGGETEDLEAAVNREVMAVRRAAGALDASTLGKLIVKGPDAGAFLDMLYTNKMSSLKPGRCRYGLMCNDNGYLFDDGVVVRLDDGSDPDGHTFLCHTTTGGAERVHGWMEEWLQTEWPHLKVFVINATEQFAQIAVAGPAAREVLEALGGDLDLSPEALPFMTSRQGRIGGFDVRVHRISFSGELSYEIAAPAAHGRPLWDALFEAGARVLPETGLTAYGTEAMHVLRAEKGYIMIGDETDGTVTPQDLGLSWAVSKKKADFIGKRAQSRPFFTDPDRKRLVGLETEDAATVLPVGAHAVEGVRKDGAPQTIGHVTTSHWSPSLERSIAMALIRRGPERMGEVVDVPISKRTTVRAKIVQPAFYDPEGERLAL